MTKELDSAVHDQVIALSEEGDALAEDEQYEDAIAKYDQAWELLPEPKTEWEAATWILVAIGDAAFLNEDYEASRDALQSAMHCPDAIGNPFIHFRLGQAQLELGNLDRAADELMRAYMAEGEEIFEDEDPKYLEFLGTRADLS